jgi:hypothetical protein
MGNEMGKDAMGDHLANSLRENPLSPYGSPWQDSLSRLTTWERRVKQISGQKDAEDSRAAFQRGKGTGEALRAFTVGGVQLLVGPLRTLRAIVRSQNRGTSTNHYEDVELRDITTLLVERLRGFSYLRLSRRGRWRWWGDGLQPELPGIALTNNNA